MRYLNRAEIEALHQMVIVRTGGSPGLRDESGLESAIAQPEMTFGDMELYGDVIEKAAALGYFLVANHPFLDGNKRIGHAAMETMLVLNGYEILAEIDDQELAILKTAAGKMGRESLTDWLRPRTRQRSHGR